jgi:hypothetical protein
MLQELADSYDRSISTMRRVTRPNRSAATWGYSSCGGRSQHEILADTGVGLNRIPH